MNSCSEKDIADFIREHYSAAGTEVEGVGRRRVRVRMPPEFQDVTDFCGLLQETFGAHVDLVVDDNPNKCVVFEVYAPHKRAAVQCVAVDEDTPGNTALEMAMPVVVLGVMYAAWCACGLFENAYHRNATAQ